MDPVKFRTKRFSSNIGIGGIDNKFNKQAFKTSSMRKSRKIKSNLGLKELLIEAEKRLKKVTGELKITYFDDLLDEYTKLDDFIRQLRWQIAVRKER